MASSGKTVDGTDGSDHLFRERIASQYKVSASYKSKLKLHLIVSLLPWTIIFCHFLQTNLNIKLTNQVLPRYEWWESLYLCNIIMIMIGYSSLQRNKSGVLTIFKFGSGVFGILPLVIGFTTRFSELKLLIFHNRFNAYLFGQPFTPLYYGFIVISLAINLHCISCSIKLLQAWTVKGFKTK